MGYLNLRFRDLGLKIMFRKLCTLRVTGSRFYVSGHGARKYSGGPKSF